MSVGAGSIKRAANAVNTANSMNAVGAPNTTGTEIKGTESVEETTTRAESIIQKAESRLAARKAAEGKPVSQKGPVPSAGRTQATGKSAAEKSRITGKAQPELESGTVGAAQSELKSGTAGAAQSELKSDTVVAVQPELKSDTAVAVQSEAKLAASGKSEDAQTLSKAENVEIEMTMEAMGEMETAAESGTHTYIIYGIGQELPIYLL